MMKIVIRVDSSTQIGSGHLMRCLTLAEQLRKKYPAAEIFFIARALVGNLNYLIVKNAYNLLELPYAEPTDNLTGYEKWLTVKPAVDAEETSQKLQQLGKVDLLVADSYAIDEAWEKPVRAYVKKLMIIDDLANRRHCCDILLDQNYYKDMQSRYNGLVPADCELRLGPKYVLLREEFYAAKKQLKKRDGSIKNIFVFFGGSDLTNETMKALKAIEMLNWDNLEVNVIVGGSNPHRSEIEAFCQNKAEFNYFCQVSNIAELMNQADIAIGAGGSTTWERCFLGLPSLVVAIADNQLQGCKDCGEDGIIFYLGKASEVAVESIFDFLQSLSKEALLKCQKDCDLW